MPRLSDTVPGWVRRYVGRRYDELGEHCGGLGCWALVRLVYAEQFGVYLPTLSDHFDGLDDVAGLARALEVERGPGGSGWDAVAGGPNEAEVGDVASFVLAGRVPHVGVMVARGRMLHAMRGVESCVERLDTPVWRRRLVEVLRLSRAPVRVIGRTRPFTGHRIDAVLPAGGTLLELMAAAGVAPTPGLRVYLGGREVPEEAWGRVRPRPGRLVTIAATPAGGKEAMRVVASLAIVAAAAFAPTAILGAAKVAALTAAGSALPAVISGAVAIGGAFALSLAAPSKPRLSEGDSRTSPTIMGARNDVRPHAPVPLVLGYHRLVPPMAALPYTENAGDDQYLRCLFAWYGPCEIDDIRIGDTPIHEYDGVEVEVRSGLPDDEPCRLYSNTVSQEPLSVLLEESAGWQVRTTGQDADEISIDLTFPVGLAQIDDEGRRRNRTVQVEVEYSPAGQGQWRRINGDAAAAGSPSNARQMDMLFRTPEVTFGGVVQRQMRICWGAGFADAKPDYLPATNYSWSAEAWFRDLSAPEEGGEYVFALDSSDAADLEIDGRIVVSWYGSHATAGGADPDYAEHASSPVRLSRGWHRIRVRMEARSTAGAVAVGWKRPGSSSFETMPASLFRTQPADGGAPGWRIFWYDTSVYQSSITTTSNRTEPIRRTIAWAVPRGQYDVRVRRVTPDSSDQTILDQVHWTALRPITNEDPIAMEGLAKIALRIKATDQLSGTIDQLNCMVRSIVPDYDRDAGTWIERASNNPASLYRWILQGRGNARPVADSRIDLATPEAVHEECRVNGWTFNAVLDFPGTLYERLSDVAAAARASFGMRDGRFSLVRDRPQTTPVQLFTPRNSWGFRGRKAFPDLPHGLRVGYLDQTRGYERLERIVLDDGYQLDAEVLGYPGSGPVDAFGNPAPDLPPATLFETIELFGITDPDLVFRHARYHIAVARLRPEIYTLEVDCEHLVCVPGDLVLVTHDVPLLGSAFGRVLRLITDDADNLIGLELDEAITMDAGVEYRITVRLADGTMFTGVVATNEGTSREIYLANPVDSTTPRPDVGDLFGFGPAGLQTRELVVQSIDVHPDLSATLTLLDHAPGVHQADSGPIPPYDPGITRPPAYADGPETPVIERIISDDWAMIRLPDGSLAPRMLISIRRPGGSRPLPSHYQVRVRPKPPPPAEPVGPWRHQLTPADNAAIAVEGVEVGVTYQIRIRAVTAMGRASAWTDAEHTVIGNVQDPPDVQAFDVQRLSDGTRRYSWTLGPVPGDIAGVVIRYGPVGTPSWDLLQPLHSGVLDAASPHERNDPPAGSYRFGIKMVDVSGRESLNAYFVDRTLGRARRPDSIATVDARIDGWPGTKTDCVVNWPGPRLEATDAATWDNLSSAMGINTWGQFWRWNLVPSTPIVYEHPPIDLGAVAISAPAVSVVADGEYRVEFRSSVNGSDWTEWLPYEQVEGVSVQARYHHWRVTVSRTDAHPVPTPRELVMDAVARPEEQVLDNIDTSALSGAYRIGPGDIRLPIDATRFQVIRTVNLTFNGTGAGWSYVVVDKDPVRGPRVQIYNPQLQLADALIDAEVRGF